MTNEYGLDVSYFKEKLGLIVRDCDRYTPEEMERCLDTYRRVAIDEGIVHGEQIHRAALDLVDELTSKDIHPGEKWFIRLQGAGALVAKEIKSITEHTVEIIGFESWEKIGTRYKFSDLEFIERFG